MRKAARNLAVLQKHILIAFCFFFSLSQPKHATKIPPLSLFTNQELYKLLDMSVSFHAL